MTMQTPIPPNVPPTLPPKPARTTSLGLGVIEAHESQVRYYCRQFPTIFAQARGSAMWDESGRRYIDFFAGGGALNYGHNPPQIKQRLISYLADDGISHSLDMATTSKVRFIKRFNDVILAPRRLRYRLMFPGSTGTDAVECALKVARRATGRSTVIGFTSAFHGTSQGTLALSGNSFKRAGAGVALSGVDRMPFDGYLGPNIDTLDYFERVLDDAGSGVDLPAAVLVETVQADGGLNVASDAWLGRLQAICRVRGILLVVDDVQVGCGRTGSFFSFESAGLEPDIVCLSNSLSGYGLPFAVTLVKPEYDCLAPGQHNGAFRGDNLAFVAAYEALQFWQTSEFPLRIEERADQLRAGLEDILAQSPDLHAEIRGRGLIQGLRVPEGGLAECIAGTAFAHGLVMETAGADNDVLKVMPPLTIDEEDLAQGLDILKAAVAEQLDQRAVGRRHGSL
jgi:diaminobutyrate-2-oxoglutarate transaminase